MTDYGLPILATFVLWWGSTGLLFYVDSLPRRTFPWTVAAATVLVGFALWGLVATSDHTTSGSAYGAFSYGLICWGWQIITYYTGFIAGPAKTACPPELRGLARFVAGVRTSLYHELSALTGAVVLLALTHNQPNQLGVWTYLTLWWMHESAKLNVFFGVPNLGEEMLPEHLRFLATYMTRRPMNMFFPFSVTISTVLTMGLAQRAMAATTAFDTIGYTMLATLMGLAVAEHWFLVAPMNANVLWAPAMNKSGGQVMATMLEGEFAALESMDEASGPDQNSENWTVQLPAICDARNFAHVLELVAAGAFGEVDAVKGAIRTPAHWIAFEFNGRKARMAPFAPQRLREPLIVATGRRFDRARLRAALENCAA
jgi:putative photosynthetic complex assembly protein 2